MHERKGAVALEFGHLEGLRRQRERRDILLFFKLMDRGVRRAYPCDKGTLYDHVIGSGAVYPVSDRATNASVE
jgi:hypothetical protein